MPAQLIRHIGIRYAFLLLPFFGEFPLQAQSEWQRDSILVVQLFDSAEAAYWNQANMERYYRFASEEAEIAARALRIQYDSSLYFHYLHGVGGAGLASIRLGNYEQGLKLLDSTVMLIQHQFGGAYFYLINMYTILAETNAQKGDFDKAAYYMKENLRLFESDKHLPGDTMQRSNTYYNAGLLFDKIEKAHLAVRYYKHAVELRTALGREMLAVKALDGMAMIYLTRQEPALAETVFLKILDIVQRGAPAARIPNCYAHLRMATVGLVLGKDSLAETHLRRAMPIPPLSALNNRQHLTILFGLDGLGDAFLSKKKYPEARDCFKQVIEIADYYEGAKSKFVVEGNRKVAESWLRQQQPDSALMVIRRNLGIMAPGMDLEFIPENSFAFRLGAGFILPAAIGQYGKALYQKSGQSDQPENLQKSLAYYSLAARIVDAMRRDFFTEGSKQVLVERAIALYEGAVETALKLHEQSGEEQYLHAAFSFAEKSKSVLLLEAAQGAKAQAFAGVPQTLLEGERDLKIDIAFYGKRIYDEQNKKQPDADKVAAWEAHANGLRQNYDSLLTVFQQQYPEYYALKYDIKYATVPQIRDHLSDARAACIEYFWGKENLYAFVITKSGVKCVRKPLSDTLEQRLERFAYLLNHPDEGDVSAYADHAGYLYDYLLAEALSGTRVTQLVIIPDGRLGYLPFQVLIDQKKMRGVEDYRDLPYVLNNYEVRYEYSSTLLLAEHRPAAQKGGFLGFAPQYGEGGEGVSVRSAADAEAMQLAPLKYNRAEAAEIGELLSGQSRTGAAATEDAFKKEAGQHRILHLAMHAQTSDTDPMYSRLIFEQQTPGSAEDGLLHAYELYNMRLNAELAVLSACQTGTGQLLNGEGIMSLSRAFKYAGCPNIVMSLWQADDASAKSIMVDFYGRLKKGKGKAAALREAERRYLKTAPAGKTHPFYWATFVLAGDGEAVGLR